MASAKSDDQKELSIDDDLNVAKTVSDVQIPDWIGAKMGTMHGPVIKDAWDVDASYYASRHHQTQLVCALELPAVGMPAKHVRNYIKDQSVLDFQPRLNTSSYVNVTFEQEEEEVAQVGMRVNLADQTVYPQSFLLHNTCINMLAGMWNCPKDDEFDTYGVFPGAGTVGSTEGCLLAGLALKFRWREWYAKKKGLTKDQVLGVRPNLVITTMFQAAWEKFFKYMDVEAHIVKISSKTFTMDPKTIEAAIDEKTIGVVCIMGNHYGGQYDPVWDVDKELTRINKEKGLQVGIHVDGASGGFIAPFQKDVPAWDFRLPNVLSISASGHKFGESCCGTGWVVWRQRKELSEHVAIHVSYLGGNAESYTLNFSRPATGVYVQLYKFLRLGRKGYEQLEKNTALTAARLRRFLHKCKTKAGKPMFTLLDAAPKPCLPVVTAMLNTELGLAYDDIDLQHALAEDRWYVSGYKMNYHNPNTGKTDPLFTDQKPEQTMFRVVVKANLTVDMCTHLIETFRRALNTLEHWRPEHHPPTKKADKEKQLESMRATC